jgi:MraZ protein
MARFFGRYEHSLDDKGRVILPAKFRPDFERGGFIGPYLDGCLALWTPQEFETQMDEMKTRERAGRDERNLARVWANNTQEVEIDKRSGRMAIPAYLRETAQLTGEVLITGNIDRVELWNPQVWAEKVGPSEQALIEGSG